MTLIINAIFAGTCGLTIALFIVQLLRLSLTNKLLIIKTISMVLLLGASLYLLQMALDTIFVYKRISSTQHFLVFLIWPIAFGLLPQLLWIKKLQGQLAVIVTMVALWVVLLCFVPWLLPQYIVQLVKHPYQIPAKISPFIVYAEIIGIYAAAFLMTYFVLKLSPSGALTSQTAKRNEHIDA